MTNCVRGAFCEMFCGLERFIIILMGLFEAYPFSQGLESKHPAEFPVTLTILTRNTSTRVQYFLKIGQ